MTAKELQAAQSYIKDTIDSQGVNANLEFEMIEGLLWCVDEFADRQLFSVSNPTVVSVNTAFVEWCRTLPDDYYDAIAPF